MDFEYGCTSSLSNNLLSLFGNILLTFKVLWLVGDILLILKSLIYGYLYLEDRRLLDLFYLCCVELRIVFALGCRFPVGFWRELIVCRLVFLFWCRLGLTYLLSFKNGLILFSFCRAWKDSVIEYLERRSAN